MFISARVELIRSCCCEKNRNATEAKKYYQTDGFFFLASDGRWWNSVGWRIGFLFFFCLSAKETLKSEFDQRIGPVSERSHRSTPHPEKQRIARFRRKKNAHTHACNLNGYSPATLTDRSFPHWPSVGLVVCVFFSVQIRICETPRTSFFTRFFACGMGRAGAIFGADPTHWRERERERERMRERGGATAIESLGHWHSVRGLFLCLFFVDFAARSGPVFAGAAVVGRGSVCFGTRSCRGWQEIKKRTVKNYV